MSYQIVSDGSCDLPANLAETRNLTVVPFYVSFDGTDYKREAVDIGVREFYEKMVRNPKVFPKSSLPSVQDYADVFFPLARDGVDILCICITTKFSGSMQSALGAQSLVLETFPDARITVIDATVNTVLQGLLVLEALDMRDAGLSFEETARNIERIKSTGRIFFTVGNMEYLQHGGRIGKLSGLAGSILGIKPLITLKEGEIFPSGITRSRKKSMEKVIGLLREYLAECGGDISAYSLAVGYGYDYEEAAAFREMVLNALNTDVSVTAGQLPIYQIGATIGVHTGPYPLGLGIIRKYDA